MSTTVTAQLADALRYALDRVTLAAINAPDDYNQQSVQHMLDYTKGMRGKIASAEREMRAALAAYDAQQAGQADAVALIREIALTEACGNSEPDVMARALGGIVGRCEGFIANHAQQPVRIRVFVKLEGGLVQWVGTSSKLPTDVAIIDYDTEGASEDEITTIPQDDGGEADAVARIDTASYDPEFVDRVFAALNTDGCS